MTKTLRRILVSLTATAGVIATAGPAAAGNSSNHYEPLLRDR